MKYHSCLDFFVQIVAKYLQRGDHLTKLWGGLCGKDRVSRTVCSEGIFLAGGVCFSVLVHYPALFARTKN